MQPKQKKQSRGLKGYSERLIRCKTPFACILCKSKILPKNYEKHCTAKHNLNSKLECVWCLGDVYWLQGKKNVYADHLLDCWEKFKFKHVALPVPSSTRIHSTLRETDNKIESPPVSFQLTPLCTTRNAYGRYRLPFLPEEAYTQTVCPADVPPLQLTYQSDVMNVAASFVRAYGKLVMVKKAWFHVMVKAVAYNDFVRAMEEDGGESTTLPFACWCDGGRTHKEPKFRQHRHMIVVSSSTKHFLSKVWDTIRPSEVPGAKFPAKRKNPIKNELHLINTIVYLGNRKSKCNFSFKENAKFPERLNHFEILNPVPDHHGKLLLALQYEDGLLQLLKQRYKNLPVDTLAQMPATRSFAKWRCKIRDLPNVDLNLVLPVSKRFVPVRDKQTPYSVHLIGDRKMYFETRVPGPADHDLSFEEEDDHSFEEDDDSEAWVASQSKAGNQFLEVVGDEAFTPRPYHQWWLNEIKPRERALEAKDAELAQCRKALDERDATIARMEREILDLREQIRSMEIEELKRLREENKTLKLKVESQSEVIASQREEIASQRGEITSQRGEITSLHSRVDTMLIDEIASLKEKLAKLEKENIYLKEQCSKINMSSSCNSSSNSSSYNSSSSSSSSSSSNSSYFS